MFRFTDFTLGGGGVLLVSSLSETIGFGSQFVYLGDFFFFLLFILKIKN